MTAYDSDEWTVEAGDDGVALLAFVRRRASSLSVKMAKRLVAEGRVTVNGDVERTAGRRLRSGDVVAVRIGAPRPRDPRTEVRIVHEDSQVVVIDKPTGMSSVPYEHREAGTAMDAIRDAWRLQGRQATKQPLHIVHRIDRATSGLLVFAKTRAAERELGEQFRAHTVERTYQCVAHGAVVARRIESRLVRDRGDRLRGSTRAPKGGKRAVTHVRPLRELAGATLCEVRLETGKTHQIRIHLSEAGHPLVGEAVYIRDYLAAGHTAIPCGRLLLHAATLGFTSRGETLRFESPLPDEFERALRRLDRLRRT